MKKYFADASLVLELILSEERETKLKVADFMANNKIYSSEFMKLEVSNVSVKRIKDFNLSQLLYKEVLGLPISYISITDSILASAREVSYKYNVSVYDATYHVIALQYGFILVTLDRKYFQKAKTLGGIQLFE